MSNDRSFKLETYDDLIQFLERDDIPEKAMNTVANKFLNTYSYDMPKDALRTAVKHHIEMFCNRVAGYETPLFLDQEQEQFNINDIYS